MPSDLKGRALMEKWIGIETSNCTPHAMKFIYHHTFKNPQDEAVLAAAGKGLDAAFTVMEAQLAKTPYLAGDSFTLADVCFMPYIDYAMGSPVKEQLAKYPHVSAWWNKVSERPTWQKTAGRPS